MLNFYSSSTGVVNSKRAITECLENALVDESNLDCDLIIFYTSMGHNFSDILNEAHKLSPNAQIVGCTGAGIIGKEGANESMKALAIMALKGQRDEFVVVSKDNVTSSNIYEVAAQMAEELKRKNAYINMIYLLLPGMDIAADKYIEGFESVLNPEIPIFGATASDNMKMVKSYQFHSDQIFEKAAIAIGFADPTLEVFTQATHGYNITGMPFEVTQSDLNCVYEFDGHSAWKFYTEKLGLPETVQPADTGPIGALAEKLPEKLHDIYGNTHILYAVIWKNDDGGMYMPVVCPKGKKLWLTRRDEDKIFNGLDNMVTQITKRYVNRKPVAVFHADCAARGRALFNRILKDEIVSRMQYPLCGEEDIPWLGIYGFGEFAMLGGRNRFHNYTTALAVIYRKDR